MTFEERVQALAPLRLTDRQTRFVVTVALHGGFCLRRQYADFARLQYGEKVRGFLDSLVDRHLARRIAYRHDRGYLYHLYASSLYRAIGQDDSRNRRLTGPALVARKLMVLDFVIAEPASEWLATEADKVAFFTERLQVPRDYLPHRVYPAADRRRPPTTRYFVDKLPIYLAGEPAVPHFVYLEHTLTQGSCEQFLADHRRLLDQLPAWTLIVLAPRHLGDVTACQRAFERFRTATQLSAPIPADLDLVWYCTTRRAVEQHQFERLSVAEIARFRDTHYRFRPALDALYRDWHLSGGAALRNPCDLGSQSQRTHATLEFRYLPHRYSQFGDLPGVC